MTARGTGCQEKGAENEKRDGLDALLADDAVACRFDRRVKNHGQGLESKG